MPIGGVASGRVGPYSLSSRLVSSRVPLISYIVHTVGPRLPESKSGSVMNADRAVNKRYNIGKVRKSGIEKWSHKRER